MAGMFTAYWNDFRFLPWVKEISNNCFSLPSSQHLLHLYSQESVFRYRIWCTTAGAAADEDYGSSPSSEGRGDGGCTFPHCSTTPRLQPEAKARCFSLYAGLEGSAPLRHTAVGRGCHQGINGACATAAHGEDISGCKKRTSLEAAFLTHCFPNHYS